MPAYMTVRHSYIITGYRRSLPSYPIISCVTGLNNSESLTTQARMSSLVSDRSSRANNTKCDQNPGPPEALVTGRMCRLGSPACACPCRSSPHAIKGEPGHRPAISGTVGLGHRGGSPEDWHGGATLRATRVSGSESRLLPWAHGILELARDRRQSSSEEEKTSPWKGKIQSVRWLIPVSHKVKCTLPSGTSPSKLPPKNHSVIHNQTLSNCWTVPDLCQFWNVSNAVVFHGCVFCECRPFDSGIYWSLRSNDFL